MKKVKFKGQLRTYMTWPLYLIIPLIICNVAVYFLDRRSGYVVSAGIAVYLIVSLILFFTNKHAVVNDMVSFATQYGQVQRQLLRDLEVPYALLDEDGRIIWTNEAFEQAFHIILLLCVLLVSHSLEYIFVGIPQFLQQSQIYLLTCFI